MKEEDWDSSADNRKFTVRLGIGNLVGGIKFRGILDYVVVLLFMYLSMYVMYLLQDTEREKV